MASLLSYAAGAGDGLDELLKNEILKQRMAEEIRHNMATESDARQTHADYALSRQDANRERQNIQITKGADERGIGGVVSGPQHMKEVNAGVPEDRYQSNVGPANIPSTIGLQTIKPPVTDTTPVDAPHMVNSIPVANSPDFWTNKGGESQQMAQRKQDFAEGKDPTGGHKDVNSQVKTVMYHGKPVDASYHPREDKYYWQGQDITADVQHYNAPTPYTVIQSDSGFNAFNPRNPGAPTKPVKDEAGNPLKPKSPASIIQGAANKQTGLTAISRLEQDIQDANQMGLLGLASGRYYSALAKLGTTGDPVKDKMIGRIKSDILLAKMHVDAGIGGMRAAASPLLLKNWEDIAISSSPDLLLGYTGAIRDDMGTASGVSGGGDAYQEYLNRHKK